MNEIKQSKLEFAKNVLHNRGILFEELPKGLLQVDNISYYATIDKFYCRWCGARGNGINRFIKHLKDEEVYKGNIYSIESKHNLSSMTYINELSVDRNLTFYDIKFTDATTQQKINTRFTKTEINKIITELQRIINKEG